MRYSVVHDYYRREHFEFYRRYRNPFYSITFELEATRLKEFIDRHGYRTYLNLCYFFTRGAQEIEDFRYRLKGDQIVLYERLHPGLTAPAAGGRFSFVHLEYDEDPHRFNRRAESLWPPPDAPPELRQAEHTNYLYFTAIPGVAFSAFTHSWDDPTEGGARVAFGKLVERSGELTVSVGVQVNHLFIDGRALGRLAELTQLAFDRPEG
jgi:chloramphenicol O-acetyltransferase type A